MRLFLQFAKRSFQRQLSYRAATIAGLMTNFFFGLLRAAVFVALYQDQEIVMGMTLADAITFTALSQAVIGFLSLFSWYDLARSVHSGEVASDLLKPMGYYKYWLARDFGRASAAFLLRGVLIMFFFDLVLDLVYPAGIINWLLLAVALFFGWLVSFSWRFIVNLISFWVPNAIGVGRFFFMISMFLSGFLMPLRFFPPWVQDIAYLTPFPHTVTTIMDVYLGLLTPQETLIALLNQIIWIVVLYLLGQLMLRAGVRRLVISGG